MKKLLVIAVALILASCTQTKIGYIDVEVLMKNYEATKQLEENLKAKQEKMAKELDSLGAPFQVKVQNYYKNAQRMSNTKRQETEAALQQENQLLQLKQQEAAKSLQEENQKQSEILTKKVDSFVADYAKANGYNLILGTAAQGTVMYGDDVMNVTDALLEKLNAEFSKE